MDQTVQPAPSSAGQTRTASGQTAVQAPSRFRALVRGSEAGLVVVAVVAGAIAGLVVTAIGWMAQALHLALFRMASHERLSSLFSLREPWMALLPAAGGLLLGLFVLALTRKRRQRPLVDPIEANALHGGRMSLSDSLIVVVQNLISNGFGASVGLEAAYTQMSSGIASRIGLSFEMRRSDLRTLVGCGAAGAIAAAFNAPLTGAFYAFELIIGTYSIATLTPVVAAALAGTLVARIFSGNTYLIDIGEFGSVTPPDYIPALILAAVAAGLGILIMQGVTRLEALFRRTRLPAVLRPVLGGLVLGGLALLTPQVLSSGHGAMHLALHHDYSVAALVALVTLKALASAVSIGSGFRGGLFFASLFLGALLGKLFAHAVALLPGATLGAEVYAVVGMSALAVSIIGGPLTMTFLALETTGDLPITGLVLAAVATASLTVRRTFGYSFATWRFHLRGESIRSAHDVGWMRNLTVGRMMRRDVRTVPAGTSLKVFRRDFPLGSGQRVVVTDERDAYAGIVLIPDAYSDAATDLDAPVDTLLRFKDAALTPQMTAKDASALFDRSESEALAVVDGNRNVIGLLTESHLLRRYSEELELRRREAAGETV